MKLLLRPARRAEDPLDNVLRQPWRPAAGAATEIVLWPESLAIEHPNTKDAEFYGTSRDFVGGRHVEVVRNVARPILAVYPAKGGNSGAAVIVFPGGGYRILARTGGEMAPYDRDAHLRSSAGRRTAPL